MAKKTPKKDLEIRFILSKIVEVIGSLLLGIVHLLGRIFFFILEVFKSIWLGLSVFIISIALLISSVGLSIWLISSAIGLSESSSFQEQRDQHFTELFNHWEQERREHRQYRAARKENVKIAEVTGVSCKENIDCTTPDDFLIRSSCAYESRCYEEQCAVVCPQAN